MDWYKIYLNNVAQSPLNGWEGLNQATTDTAWSDTTQLRTIKEQAYPFTDEYTEQEVWVTTVADISINTNKDISDFISVMFQDNNRNANHRGQKYLYDPHGDDSWQTYLCYDTIEPLAPTATTKLVRCNNYIRWIDKDSGDIITEPCFIGYELSSYSNQVSKEGTTENRKLTCTIQGNENTLKITPNQRFIIGHRSAFKITQVNSYMMEDVNTEDVTFLVMYIEWCSILPTDDLDNNIADMGSNNYQLTINSSDIQKPLGYSDTLTASITLNNEPIESDLTWYSSDESVVTIDEDGVYTIVGAIGTTATIYCYLTDYTDIYATLNVEVVEEEESNYVLKVTPNITQITELSTQTLTAKVYEDGVEIEETVSCVADWQDDEYYTLTDNSDNIFELYNANRTTTPLTLTFSADNCDDVVMEIKLQGLF